MCGAAFWWTNTLLITLMKEWMHTDLTISPYAIYTLPVCWGLEHRTKVCQPEHGRIAMHQCLARLLKAQKHVRTSNLSPSPLFICYSLLNTPISPSSRFYYLRNFHPKPQLRLHLVKRFSYFYYNTLYILYPASFPYVHAILLSTTNAGISRERMLLVSPFALNIELRF